MNAGTYVARAIHASLIESKNKGTPAVEIVFQVEGEGQVTAQLWLTDRSEKRTIEALRYCGWQGDDIDDLSTVGSKDCQIVVEDEEYDGKVRAKVKWVNALGSGAAPLETGARQYLRDRIRASIRGEAPPAQPSSAPDLPPAEDSDIPF